MAALQNIRNHATLLIGIVALALAAFVVGDFLTSTSTILGRARSIVGEVNGKEISIVEFNEKEKQFSEIIKQQYAGQQTPNEGDIRNFVWNKFINDALIESEMEEIGMAVTNDEISDVVSSANHPMLMNIPYFRDQSGRFNPAQVSAFLGFISRPDEDFKSDAEKAQQQQLKAEWSYWEGQIKSQLANDKLANLVSNAISYPSAITNIIDKIAENEKTAVIINKSYSSANKDIEVSDADKKNMYEKMKKQYFTLNNGGYRSMDAIVFNVKPSQQDYEDAKAGMEEMKAQIKNADEAELKLIFSDPSSVFAYNNVYRSENDIEAAFQSFAFNAKKDSVSDVIFERGDFMVARKMADIKIAPDSANVSIIVLAGKTKEEVSQRVDSVKKCINNGEKFEDLAAKLSVDKNTANKGGELGWLKEGFPLGTDDFDSKVFSGSARKGDILTFDMPENPLSFIVKINNLTTPVRKSKVLVFGSKLEPSTDTYQNTYNQANKFIIDNKTKDEFIASADTQNLEIMHLSPLGENDPYIQFLGQNTREIIKWAWSHEVGNVSGVFEVGDSYIVGTLVNAVEGDFIPLSEQYVANQVELKAKNEVCAKKFAEEIANDNDFSKADTVNLNFIMNSVSGIGREPKLIGTISSLPVETTSDAIIGEMGVYKVKVINENPSTRKSNISALNRDLKGMVMNRMFESLRKDAEVNDNRSNFY